MAQEINIILTFIFIIIGIILAVRYKQPLVFWLLLIGAVIGPYGLKIISDDSIIKTISDFGAIFLLFTLGVKFSINKLLKQGFKPIIITSIKILFIMLLSFYFITFLGFDSVTSWIISFIIAITSTAIVIKVIEQYGWIDYKEVHLIVNILIIEDVFGVLLLTFLSGFGHATLSLFIIKIVMTLIVLVLTYYLVQFLFVPFTTWVIKNSNEDVIPFIAFGLAVGLSYMASRFDLSPSAGAFLAGSVITFLPNSGDFEYSISSFTLIFSSIFFLSVGMLVNFSILLNFHIIMTIMLIILAIIFIKLFVVTTTVFFTGYDFKEAVFSGIALIPIGEFSLLIAKELVNNTQFDIISFISLSILITSVITSILMPYHKTISEKINLWMPTRAKVGIWALKKTIKIFNLYP